MLKHLLFKVYIATFLDIHFSIFLLFLSFFASCFFLLLFLFQIALSNKHHFLIDSKSLVLFSNDFLSCKLMIFLSIFYNLLHFPNIFWVFRSLLSLLLFFPWSRAGPIFLFLFVIVAFNLVIDFVILINWRIDFFLFFFGHEYMNMILI